jgi:hypothetical protein
MKQGKNTKDHLPEGISRSEVAKFSTLALAKGYRDQCIKLHLIVLGDDGLYWVALPRITERLVGDGYEYAE